MSNDTIPQPTTSTQRPSTDPDAPQEPRLQREAVVLVHDRGRFAVLVALCTLAGVAVGFVLGSFAGASGASDCSAGAAVSEAPPEPERPRVGTGPGFAPVPPSPGSKTPVHPYMPDGIDIWTSDPHAWLGVKIEDHPDGARVTRVMPGSPAAEAGIEQSDVIQQVDGESVATASQLSRLVRDYDPGDEVGVVLERNGDEIALHVALGEMGGQSRVRIR